MRKITLAYVQSQLLALQSELDELQSQRKEYMHKVRLIDKKIAKIKGGEVEMTSSEIKSRDVGNRIYDKMVEVLQNLKNKTFTPDEIASAFFTAGGRSDSAQPKSVLMQVIRKMPGVFRKSRGVYTYKPKGQ